MARTYGKAGGVWSEIRPLHAYDGGEVEIETGYAKRDGIWRVVYKQADPEEIVTTTTWFGVYNDNDLYEGSQRDKLGYQGDAPSYERDETTLYGFDHEALRAALLERPNIVSVHVTIECRWSYSGSGKTFDFGQHNYASKPTTITIPTPFTEYGHHFFARGERRTIQLPNSFAEAIRDGHATGLAMPYTGEGQAWGYMAAKYTTKTLTASPSDSDLRLAVPGEKPDLHIVSDY